MPAAQPLPLDTLRRLIVDNNYWNPRSPQYETLQQKVREGFGRLYPAKGDSAEGSGLERDRTDDGSIEDIQKRYNEVSNERRHLLLDNAPQPVIDDKDRNMVQDYKPADPQILDRIEELKSEEDRLRDLLGRLGVKPDIQL